MLTEDELGRSGFATAVAKIIGNWAGRESLVVAIYGPWGSGKTSLKNMILDALRNQNSKTIRLEFNPWEWAGQEKVFEGFFGELSSKLGSVNASNKAAEAAKKMRMYAAMLSAAASITGSGRSLLIGFLSVLAFFGLAPLFHSSGLVTILKVLGGLALLAAVALAALGKTADRLAGYLTAKAEANRKSVEEVKNELHDLLRDLQQNVLVVVDDVDRLTPEGIRMVFQLVKVNADFPNLVYLLLFQRDTIERALARMDRTGEGDGAEFLQKVVQVGFDIPKLSPQKLEESLELVISRVVEGTPANSRFDSRRWARLFVSGIKPYFQTLRDVKRFSNTLSFHFELYRSGDTFDANPIDLIALEVLRQFEAPIYQRLHRSKALLTGAPLDAFGPSFTGEKKKAAETLLENANRMFEVRSILEDLFPPIVRALAESKGMDLGDRPPDAGFRKEWLRDLRPCHYDVFERYFKFSLSAEDISEGELNSLLAVMGDRNSLVRKLKETDEKGLLGAAMLRLRVRDLIVPSESAVPFITGLFDVEKELLAQRQVTGVATVPAHMQAVLVIESVLRQKPVEARGPILREAIERTTALFLPLISFEFSDERRKEALDSFVSEEDAKTLQELCIRKIKEPKVEQELLAHPMLRYILNFWCKWDYSEASTWFNQISESGAKLPSLLRAFVEAMNELKDGRIVEVRYRFALEEFARYMKPDRIEERVRRLALSEGEHQFAYRLFLCAFDRSKATGVTSYPQNLDEWTTRDLLN
jgi:predicted KAP-like P-loop ATPase